LRDAEAVHRGHSHLGPEGVMKPGPARDTQASNARLTSRREATSTGPNSARKGEGAQMKPRAHFPVAVLVTLLALAGAATAQESLEGVDWDSVDPSGQTVTFWHQHTQERETALQEIIAVFNETNEYEITVVAEYQGGYGDIFQKMLALLGTSDTPNIVVAYQKQAATYQLVDGLVGLNRLVESERWGLSEEDIADFFPGFWNSDVFPSFDDTRLGIAPNRSMEMLYYNIDWLAELREGG